MGTILSISYLYVGLVISHQDTDELFLWHSTISRKITKNVIATYADAEDRLGQKNCCFCCSHCSCEIAADCGKLVDLLGQWHDHLLAITQDENEIVRG